MFDPLDGSSNIDVDISIGTIFSIHRRVTVGRNGTLADCLQRGSSQVAAGYVIYGSSTVLVYSTGDGVHGFTLDPSVGEFFLSHENIRIPAKGKTYSVNEGNSQLWPAGLRRWAEAMKTPKPNADGTMSVNSARYVGSLVADFHRTLLKGGVFAYPADAKSPKGKLRLLYEAAPMAFICEAAGGRERRRATHPRHSAREAPRAHAALHRQQRRRQRRRALPPRGLNPRGSLRSALGGRRDVGGDLGLFDVRRRALGTHG
jgi:fructose-1,6-bisphosphatase I